MSAQSYQNLKRQVVELVAVNEALSEKLAAFIVDHEATVAELTETVQVTAQERDQLRGWYHEERKKSDRLQEDRKRYEEERDKALQDLNAARWTLVGVEREREAARAYAEAMRQQAFPAAPQFPWEQRRSAEETVHMHRTYERL